ncbi:hypothetical protein TrVE_jg13525 [Triparma verrucosa]|uniref:MORN repeat-containing protein 3 n=2 Tax=Triparma TaxID=722752 RepID=A0A9W7BDR6_9STRA|nr:hypothetical protein TrST_g13658 [Triparma strigata]GMI06286.1 hypothetical protein TrVE_jg13525 [Triparma verrucosa]
MSDPITILIGPDSIDPDRPKFQGSKAKFALAEKEGSRKTVFTMVPNKEYYKNLKLNNSNANTFSHKPGGKYKGRWSKNKKEGFGTQTYTNGSVYEGEWVSDVRHGKGTYYVMSKSKKLVKQYAGDWVNDKREGLGVWTGDKGRYEGEWLGGKMEGKGKMEYTNGEVYEGEWKSGGRDGMGVLGLENGDKYIGMFKNDKKDGPGRFEYYSTGKVYEGEWMDGTPKCGEFKNMVGVGQETFNLPSLTLTDANAVLGEAVAGVRQNKAETARPGTAKFSSDDMSQIRLAFSNFSGEEDLIKVVNLAEVIGSLGIQLQEGVLEGLLEKIGAEMDDDISYPEFVDIVVVVASGV